MKVTGEPSNEAFCYIVEYAPHYLNKMNKRARSFLLAFVAGGCLQAQYVFTVNGTLLNCAPNTIVQISDSLSGVYTFAELNGDCGFSTTIDSPSPSGDLLVQGLCANGTFASGSTSYLFDQPGDTLTFSLLLTCGPDPVDCLGITNGPAMPGTACDDGDPATNFDMWGADCMCMGFDSTAVLDCLGQPNGGNLPGTPCFDPNNPVFPLGLWSIACVCEPDSSFLVADCLGILGGTNLPGGYCDDGDAATEIDLWDVACQCIGLDSTQVVFDCLGIPNGGNLPGAPCVDNGSPFLIGTWSADCLCAADSSYTFFDCLGIQNGPDMPGSACDDGNPFTGFDAWNANCICAGQDTTGTLDCLGIPNGPNLPGLPCTILPDSSNTVVGNWGPDCVCYATMFDCTGVPGGPNMPGVACDDGNPTSFNDLWNANCACIGTDTTLVVDCAGIPDGPNQPGTFCFEENEPFLFGVWTADCICAVDSTLFPTDCLGVFGGPDQPGAPCNDGDPSTTFDFWDNACQCIGLDSTQVVFDCLGQANGGSLPGTPCLNENDPFLLGLWTADCACGPDSTWMVLDCLGVLGGQAYPGTTCDDGDPSTEAFWSVDCQCAVPVPQPCTAGFVVLPMNVDTTSSEPIMLFIFNTSFGGDGNYSFLWEFGDGATSTDPWPVHAYAGNGPYEMCLTLADGSGCTNTYCDTLSLDEFGIFGMVLGGDRSTGFMVAVQSGSAPTVVTETRPLESLSCWPNPVSDQLNIQLSSRKAGPSEMLVLDANGRIVERRTWNMSSGRNRLEFPTSILAPGAYVLRISTPTGAVEQRFVRIP